ncbi:MAG: class I SAM-dependent methyltransferase [Pyrinomonadaceae bacterium]
MKAGAEQYNWVEQICPICNLKPTGFVGKRGGASHRSNIGVEAEIWSCGECGLIFPDPMPMPRGGLSQHYDLDADDYFSNHDKDVRLGGARNIVVEAERLLGRKGKLLDVGVGRGEVLFAAQEQGWDVSGIEPSTTFADYAEGHSGAKIWRKPIEECDLPEGEYDVVILAAVLEHLYQPDTVIEKLARSMTKGGLLFVDVPNERGLYFRAGNAYQKIRGRDWCVNLAPTFSPFHVFGFGPRSLRKLLKKHGLEPKVWTVYGGTSLVPSNSGIVGTIEGLAAGMITRISDLWEMGTYIETWAEKK